MKLAVNQVKASFFKCKNKVKNPKLDAKQSGMLKSDEKQSKVVKVRRKTKQSN